VAEQDAERAKFVVMKAEQVTGGKGKAFGIVMLCNRRCLVEQEGLIRGMPLPQHKSLCWTLDACL
jgi:hypothetical protein